MITTEQVLALICYADGSGGEGERGTEVLGGVLGVVSLGVGQNLSRQLADVEGSTEVLRGVSWG
jgi:hypothetical protein